MGAKKIGWNDSVPAQPENFEAATHSRDCIKVYREPLEHLMFRGRMDWIGAWLLLQAAADPQTNRVNLTDVGRKADHDFGWDNDRWRRFVKRLEKEGFIATVDKQNFGSKIGHVHIAVIVYPAAVGSYGSSTAGDLLGAARVHHAFTDNQITTSARGRRPNDAGAEGGATVGAKGQASNEGVWLEVDDTDDEDVP